MPLIEATKSILRRWPWARNLKMDFEVRAGRGLLVPPAELQGRYQAALATLSAGGGEVGDYLEFGVFNGTSMLCMHRALLKAGLVHPRLVGFDSFEGMPTQSADEDNGVWKPGQFFSSLEYTRARLSREGVDWKRTHLIKGWFSETATPETARRLKLQKAGVIMIDCDLYSSTVDALLFCEPLIRDRAVIFFDDWHWGSLAEQGLGERRAFDEFLARHTDIEAGPFESYGESSVAFLLTRRAPEAD
ncbi:MAG: uncharacterized protein JWQ33_2637 [Ramlibacter sp.]|nr:uncharacterized protein [Ramlibacter sp.]